MKRAFLLCVSVVCWVYALHAELPSTETTPFYTLSWTDTEEALICEVELLSGLRFSPEYKVYSAATEQACALLGFPIIQQHAPLHPEEILPLREINLVLYLENTMIPDVLWRLVKAELRYEGTGDDDLFRQQRIHYHKGLELHCPHIRPMTDPIIFLEESEPQKAVIRFPHKI